MSVRAREIIGFACVLVVFCLLGAARPAHANMGKPIRDGVLVADPDGIGGVQVVGEHLVIDMTGLQAGLPVRVTARYRLRNPGPMRRLRPVFATGNDEVAGFVALLDREPVAMRRLKGFPLPASWRAPETTPSLDGKGTQWFEAAPSGGTPIGLDFTLPPGEHEFEVQYQATAQRQFMEGPTLLWQFAYVLAPARTWAGFGTLELEIRIPEGWRIATAPEVPRGELDGHDQRYTAKFDGVPADAIGITVQVPPGWRYRIAFYATLAVFLLALFGTIPWACRPLARRLANGRQASDARRGRSFLHALAGGAIWSAALLCTGLVALYLPGLLLPEAQAYSFGYGEGLALVALIAVSVLALFAGMLAVWILARRLSRERTPAARP